VNFALRTMRGLLGLFVDDGTLALTLIAVIVVVGVLVHLGAIKGVLAMVLLLAGTIGALLINVTRAASSKNPG